MKKILLGVQQGVAVGVDDTGLNRKFLGMEIGGAQGLEVE